MVGAKHIVQAGVEVLCDFQAGVVLVESSIAVGRRLILLVDVLSGFARHFVGRQKVDLWLDVVWIVAFFLRDTELVFRCSHLKCSFPHVLVVQLSEGGV